MLHGWFLVTAACSIAVPGADFDSAGPGSAVDTGAFGDDSDDDGDDDASGDGDGSADVTSADADGASEDGDGDGNSTGAVDDPGSTGSPASGGGSGPASGSGGSGPASGSGPSGSGGTAPPTPPPEPGPFCGDGSVDPGEVCDLGDLGGEDCESLGFGPGVLICQAGCNGFNTAACSVLSSCGDGHADPDEECDGQDMDGEHCGSLGYDIGVLQCHDDCTYDTSTCVNL